MKPSQRIDEIYNTLSTAGVSGDEGTFHYSIVKVRNHAQAISQYLDEQYEKQQHKQENKHETE